MRRWRRECRYHSMLSSVRMTNGDRTPPRMKVDCHYSTRDGIVFYTLTATGIPGHDAPPVEEKLDLDASTFVDLGSGYAKDATQVVYFGEIIEGADAPSFTVLAGGYAKDAHEVYSDGSASDDPDGSFDAASFVAFGARYVADRRG